MRKILLFPPAREVMRRKPAAFRPPDRAVFQGNAALTRFLLEHGASWRERHKYNSDVIGTLCWASCNRPAENGDWYSCAAALVEYGMPRAQRPPGSDPDELPRYVIIDGREQEYPEDITALLLSE